MNKPQIENGYIRIANDIVKQFHKYRLSGEEWMVLWTILSKTYGWNKKEDFISYTQFEKMTGLKRSSIYRSIKKLLAKKLIVVSKKANSQCNSYRFNKLYTQWKPISKKATPIYQKANTLSTKKLTKVSTKKLPTKDNKDTNTKDILSFSKKKYLSLQEKIDPYKRLPIEKQQSLHRVVYFLEDTLNTRVTNWGKQSRAWDMIRRAGFTEKQTTWTIKYMAEEDQFFQGKGFDLMTVANQMPRYKTEFSKKRGDIT